MNSQKEMN